MQAAYLHILGDIINSVGVLVASLLIYVSDGKLWFCDPLCTYVFGFLVFYTTRQTFVYCVNILLERSPVDVSKLRKELLLRGCADVQRLRVWAISDTKTVATLHITLQAQAEAEASICAVEKVLRNYGV